MIENCTCAGVKNKWGEGAECKVYSEYDEEFLNSKWCYAETTSCTDATSIEYSRNLYVDEGRFGASHRACLKDAGKTLSKDIYNIKHLSISTSNSMRKLSLLHFILGSICSNCSGCLIGGICLEYNHPIFLNLNLTESGISYAKVCEAADGIDCAGNLFPK